MALYSCDGKVTITPSSSDVVFMLKNSKGETLKVYKVPQDKAASFQKEIESEKKTLTSAYHDEVHLVRVEKIM